VKIAHLSAHLAGEDGLDLMLELPSQRGPDQWRLRAGFDFADPWFTMSSHKFRQKLAVTT